ncbi:hypothetical protein M3Y96_00020000 [Aphelenchoides besseyi]|nr:hypothetical protein M3Y96_00020000 [Aphelenchoides besseyi]
MFQQTFDEILYNTVTPIVLTTATVGLLVVNLNSGCRKKKNGKARTLAAPQPQPVVPVQVVPSLPVVPAIAPAVITPSDPTNGQKSMTAKTDLNTSDHGGAAKVMEEKKAGVEQKMPSKKEEKAKPTANTKEKKNNPKKSVKPKIEHSAKDPEPDQPATDPTQPSVSQKVGHDDDTVKNIDSIKPDKHKSE